MLPGLRVLAVGRGWLTARLVAVAAVVMIGAAGCGGSSKSTPAQTHTTSAGKTSPTPTSGGRASVSTGPVRATLHGADHAPIAGKPWPYYVRVTDAAGSPLSGTVEIEFTFGGQVVGRDSPPTHPIKHGLWHDNLTYPKQAVGQPLTLQAVVHTSKGSVTLGWPVTVRP